MTRALSIANRQVRHKLTSISYGVKTRIYCDICKRTSQNTNDDSLLKSSPFPLRQNTNGTGSLRGSLDPKYELQSVNRVLTHKCAVHMCQNTNASGVGEGIFASLLGDAARECRIVVMTPKSKDRPRIINGRIVGLLRSKLTIPDDFDALLPSELQNAFEGAADGVWASGDSGEAAAAPSIEQNRAQKPGK